MKRPWVWVLQPQPAADATWFRFKLTSWALPDFLSHKSLSKIKINKNIFKSLSIKIVCYAVKANRDRFWSNLSSHCLPSTMLCFLPNDLYLRTSFKSPVSDHMVKIFLDSQRSLWLPASPYAGGMTLHITFSFSEPQFSCFVKWSEY